MGVDGARDTVVLELKEIDTVSAKPQDRSMRWAGNTHNFHVELGQDVFGVNRSIAQITNGSRFDHVSHCEPGHWII